jgi:O-antigen/teichoic acid export membrane protein
MNGSRVRDLIIQQLLRSVISNYVGRFIGMGIWFLLTPFILNQLEPTLYGLWVLVGSVMAYGSLLDFGISSTLAKYVAEYRAKGQAEDAQSLIGTALVIYLILGILIIVAAIILAPFFSRIFNVPAENRSTAMWLVMLAGLGTGSALLSNSTTAVLRGLQRYDLLNLIGVISTLLLAGATVLVLVLGGGVIGIAATGVAVNSLMLIPTIWIIHQIAPDLRFGLVGASGRMFRAVTSFSSSIFMLHVGGHLSVKTDEIVVGAFLPVSAVTPYNLARRLSSLPQMLTDQFLTLLLPLASKLHAENNLSRLRSVYIISTRLTLAIFLPAGLGLVFLAGPFLEIWIGPEYSGYVHLVLILSLASLIDTCTWPAGAVLQGMGLPRFSGLMSIISGSANLVLSLILVRRLGLTGVALGTLIPTAIVCLGFVIPYAARMIGVRFQEVIVHILLPAFLPVVPAGIGMYLLRDVVKPTSIILILLLGATGLLIYLAIYLCMRANEFERGILRMAWLGILYRAKPHSNASERSG